MRNCCLIQERVYQSEEERDKDFAREYVVRLSEDTIRDMAPLARIERVLHTGTDAFGDRLSPEAKATLRRTRDALLKSAAEKYAPNLSPSQFHAIEYVFHLDIEHVSQELMKRVEELE